MKMSFFAGNLAMVYDHNIIRNILYTDPTVLVFSLDEDTIHQMGIKHLPETLHEAVGEFKKSSIIKDTLGNHIFTKYLEAKEKEWKEYHTSVSEYELKKYLGR